MKRLLAAAVLAAIPFAIHFLPGDAPPGKPTPPIDLDVRVVGRTDPGLPFGLIVTATPRAAGDGEMRITLPAGALVRAGDARWKGRFKAGQPCELRLDLSVPDRVRREILVTVECAVDGSTRLARCESIVLHDAPQASQGVPGRSSRGEGILDFPQK